MTDRISATVSGWHPDERHLPSQGTRDQTVLRISLVEVLDQAVTLRLEGQVRGPWVEELRQACEQLLARDSALLLDLGDVSFIDMDGVALCRRLRAQNVGILHCSPFVAEQLKG
jgi:hypothetical protein